MKKGLFVIVAACAVLLTACSHEHTFKEATCTDPKTCTICGETEGEPIDHSYSEATCTEMPTCIKCGATKGASLGHDWVEATCTAPKKCSRCGEEYGQQKNHTVEEKEVIEKATCTKSGRIKGKCSVCNQEVFIETEPLGHKPGKFKVVKKATYYTSGEKSKTCKRCGEELETKTYELSEKEKEKQFKADCNAYTYEQVARDPDSVFDDNVVFTGEVIQVLEYGMDCEMRVNITPTRWGYTDTIYVTYTRKDNEPRILEDDIVTIWGYIEGTKTYSSILGAQITIPYMDVKYLEIK